MVPAVLVPDDERPFTVSALLSSALSYSLRTISKSWNQTRRTSAPARIYPKESKTRVLYHKLKEKAEKAVSRIFRRNPKSPVPAASGYEILEEQFDLEWDWNSLAE